MVSVDKPEDNKGFAEKEQADFPILSDPDKKVAFAYGVIPPDRPPDRQFASRWTFYIGPDGKILAIDKGATGRGINPATAGQDLITKLTELGVKKKSAAKK
jgi:peroxiredoxin Q/BCP